MYSPGEVQALIEGYQEFSRTKDTSRGRIGLLVRLCDLDVAFNHLPSKPYQAVLLVGLLNIPTREAGELLGVSSSTVGRWYLDGIEWMTDYLNGRNPN